MLRPAVTAKGVPFVPTWQHLPKHEAALYPNRLSKVVRSPSIVAAENAYNKTHAKITRRSTLPEIKTARAMPTFPPDTCKDSCKYMKEVTFEMDRVEPPNTIAIPVNCPYPRSRGSSPSKEGGDTPIIRRSIVRQRYRKGRAASSPSVIIS